MLVIRKMLVNSDGSDDFSILSDEDEVYILALSFKLKLVGIPCNDFRHSMIGCVTDIRSAYLLTEVTLVFIKSWISHEW